ncbi:hypothetical protein DPMN_147397 [Dreissena polymorpha]|uniref:Uncharacterized protein n=1 Tax=Dreissena polymorpha TaxID=45954 RepID=A0A9D4F9T4_DREPO|nr:hypothetical protein DPMN_147397 [Dreissena polymorpha]
MLSHPPGPGDYFPDTRSCQQHVGISISSDLCNTEPWVSLSGLQPLLGQDTEVKPLAVSILIG